MTSDQPRPALVVIGPSGSGKSSVVRALADRGVIRVHPTWTTRPPRPDELDGSPEHVFVTEDRFDELVEEGFFLDTVAMFGLPYRYGLPTVRPSDDGRVDTIMLRAALVDRLKPFVASFVVYQIEDTTDRVRERLIARGCPADELAARLRDNEVEVALGRRIADRVFVNDGPLLELVDAIADTLPVAVGA